MLGLFNTLNLGARSLQAQQTAVEITGQNLANVNNPAYARQRAQVQTSDAMNTPYGPQGTGVQVVAIQQVRDSLLDAQVRDESSIGGYWDAQQGGLQNAEAQLGSFVNATGTVGDTTGTFADQLSSLFNAFQAVATNPASQAPRQSLVNQAQSLAAGFNQAAQSLTTIRNSLDTSLSNDVTSANQLLSDIANLNNQIGRSELATGGIANDLRDLREQKLENLAKLVNFQIGGDSGGGLSISIDGNQLVDGKNTLDTLETYDAGGGQMLVRTATSATPLALSGGSMQGKIDVRDGALQTFRTNLDSLASTLIAQVNGIYSSGYDLAGNTGANFFTGTDAASIGVNAVLQTNPSLIQAAGTPNASGDNAVALALAQLGQQPQAALNNQTFSEAHAALASNFGNALANANNQVANHDAVSSLLLQQRDSVSGVSIDEEMANLLSFQKAYTASARIVTTVDDMLNTILQMKR